MGVAVEGREAAYMPWMIPSARDSVSTSTYERKPPPPRTRIALPEDYLVPTSCRIPGTIVSGQKYLSGAKFSVPYCIQIFHSAILICDDPPFTSLPHYSFLHFIEHGDSTFSLFSLVFDARRVLSVDAHIRIDDIDQPHSAHRDFFPPTTTTQQKTMALSTCIGFRRARDKDGFSQNANLAEPKARFGAAHLEAFPAILGSESMSDFHGSSLISISSRLNPCPVNVTRQGNKVKRPARNQRNGTAEPSRPRRQPVFESARIPSTNSRGANLGMETSVCGKYSTVEVHLTARSADALEGFRDGFWLKRQTQTNLGKSREMMVGSQYNE
ncbi:uncharacterized protein EV420DRAFT_1644321 [Desarmillaria tabescens]|uniref:Uncharacterized protein n=1 Tax=Armillaria tabescens TaxID=1929756 RepID=A0AA39N3U2_ARMTA|nr:uncharacterized protein EV420DRAFT_1644321 [Desarmillaria tabescens]KAK0457171.1 hypothetical protein EV420DRAFT_1644321 [Desarmillaria tabescens]